MDPLSEVHRRWMARALELAFRGEGSVEPNPMVGCVVCQNNQCVGEGWHQAVGGPHAEIHALHAAGPLAQGATLYVSLEPCCHQGRTPPCTRSLLEAGIQRVVVGCDDPDPRVAGKGLATLADAGIEVVRGVRQPEAERLIAPFTKRTLQGLPWVIAKWAMSLDGRMAAPDGSSRWISNELARQKVHLLRGRVDAVVVGIRTAIQDDPLLTARPPGPRIPLRVVLDSRAELSLKSQLVRTARRFPLLAAVSQHAQTSRCDALADQGVEIVVLPGQSHGDRMRALLEHLAGRGATNVLVEGGAFVLGTLFDHQLVDEVSVFVAPLVLGGKPAPNPLEIARSAPESATPLRTPTLAPLGPLEGGTPKSMSDALRIENAASEVLGDNIWIHGRIMR